MLDPRVEQGLGLRRAMASDYAAKHAPNDGALANG